MSKLDVRKRFQYYLRFYHTVLIKENAISNIIQLHNFIEYNYLSLICTNSYLI